MKQSLTIYFQFQISTKHQHPDLNTVLENYLSMLEEMGFNESESKEIIDNLTESAINKYNTLAMENKNYTETIE